MIGGKYRNFGIITLIMIMVLPQFAFSQSSTINIFIDLDGKEHETSWRVTSPQGSTLINHGSYTDSDETIDENLIVDEAGTYTFTIFDSGFNGLSFSGGSNENGTAIIRISVDGIIEFETEELPNFGGQFTFPFFISLGNSAGSIGGFVWEDANHDGIQNDGGGLEGILLELYDGTFAKIDEIYTNISGWYEFVGLESGDYIVIVDQLTLPIDLNYQTYDYDGINTPHAAQITLGLNEINNDVDFGYSDTPLPVELSSFEIENVSSGVLINWVTESEIENLGFVLERRNIINGDWIEISNYLSNKDIEGQGTVTYRTEYEYLDKLVVPNNTYQYRIGDVDYDGKVVYHAEREITVVGSKQNQNILTELTVNPAVPNPFNPITKISYGLVSDSKVLVNIYGIDGRLITTLVDEYKTNGWHSVIWNGRNDHGKNIPGGVYIARISTGVQFKSIKLILLK